MRISREARRHLKNRKRVLRRPIEQLERRLLLSGTGTINGTVYNDLNANGVRDAGEPAVAGITLSLSTGSGTITTLSDSNGAFTFQNVPAGPQFLTETAPSPLMYDINQQFITVVAGQTSTTVLSVRPAGSPNQISGTVYDDLNGNGTLDAGEGGLAGTIVFQPQVSEGYYQPGDISGTSDSQGKYHLTVPGPGTFELNQNPPFGYLPTNPSFFAFYPNNYHFVTLTSQQFVTNINFLSAPKPTTASLSGVVFSDTNGDGIQQQGEPGMGSVTVFLDKNYNGVLDAGEPSTVTSATGQYSFSNLLTGSYFVQAKVASSYTLSYPYPPYASYIEYYLMPGDSASANFSEMPIADGIVQSGKVFNDYNANGQYDAGEPGLAGLRVYDDANNNGQWDSNEPTAITDSNGNYTLSGLVPTTLGHKINVKLIPQPGWGYTPSGFWFACSPIGRGTITGTVFSDNNGNGVQDAGEGGLQTVFVYIDMNNDGSFDGQDVLTATDANGNFTYSDVWAGTYTIRMEGISNWEQTYPAQGGGLTVMVNPGGVSNIDFGLAPPNGSISGTIFYDSNYNGIWDAGESGGRDSVYVDLNNNGVPDPNEPGASATNGTFTISGLNAGTYTVRLDSPVGIAQTYPSGNAAQIVTVKNAATTSGINFGIIDAKASITVSAFNDLNGNGIKDAGENAFPGGMIYIDANDNGIYDSGEPKLTSSLSTTFSNLAPGTYMIRTAPATGWVQTYPAADAAQVVHLAVDQTITLPAFGEAASTASLSGNVFDDFNGNGSLDAGEAGLSGWQVFLDQNNDGIDDNSEPALTSDASGNYVFSGLIPGNYTIRIVPQPDWTQTTPISTTQGYALFLVEGANDGALNFGEVHGQASISGSSTPIFTGDDYTLNLAYAGPNAPGNWSIDWGDGNGPETIDGNPGTVDHTFGNDSGTAAFSISAWANSVDGTVPAAPVQIKVYPNPQFDGGTLDVAGTPVSDQLTISGSAGLVTINLGGAVRQYNRSLVQEVNYFENGGSDQITIQGNIAAVLNLSSGNDTIVNSDAAPLTINPGTGKLDLDAADSGSTTTVSASSGVGIRQVAFSSLAVGASAKVLFANSSPTLGNYSDHANRTLAIVDAGGLNIASGGTLDIGDNSMLLKYLAANKSATDSMINSLLTSGYAGGAWDGDGITSSEANYDAFFGSASRAVGWADQQDVGVNSFEGDSVDVADGNEIMIKFTYYGDTDLDGKVASSDSANFSTGVHLTGDAYWEFGDFDYSGGKPAASDSQAFSTGLHAYKAFGSL